MNQSEQRHLAPPRNADTGAFWRTLHAQATAPHRSAGKFAWHFARGKLGRDPVFRGMLERGDLRSGRVLDIGCGQGLLAGLLHACRQLSDAGRWLAAWPAAPRASTYTGIELMPRDVHRAETSVGRLALGERQTPRFVCGDMCGTPLPDCDLVVILEDIPRE